MVKEKGRKESSKGQVQSSKEIAEPEFTQQTLEGWHYYRKTDKKRIKPWKGDTRLVSSKWHVQRNLHWRH